MTPNRIIHGRDEAVAAWVARQIPHVGPRGFGPCRALAVVCGDRPLAGFVLHDYQPEAGTIQISMAAVSPLWAKPDTIRGLLAVPFQQYGCFKVWTCIPHDNERAIRFNEGIGMKSEATLRHQFGRGRHARIFGMTAPEWRAKWRVKEAA